jgi:hypothetical protein
MLNDQELITRLRSIMPPVEPSAPSSDLWPSVVQRTRRIARWSIADWSAVAIVVISLLMFPEWFWFLAYHL